ncbi:hypothetical protein L596_003083 [Steinernema carpocapsae]|uniref:ShKT domain-containing protein n=1 Tax=Steinernema carpocapsae TaxID=34508 RepID=A0A4U8UUA2_STECR|nr:hypothetical protein L596_003083 [Steinernema carpocapsae]
MYLIQDAPASDAVVEQSTAAPTDANESSPLVQTENVTLAAEIGSAQTPSTHPSTVTTEEQATTVAHTTVVMEKTDATVQPEASGTTLETKEETTISEVAREGNLVTGAAGDTSAIPAAVPEVAEVGSGEGSESENVPALPIERSNETRAGNDALEGSGTQPAAVETTTLSEMSETKKTEETSGFEATETTPPSRTVDSTKEEASAANFYDQSQKTDEGAATAGRLTASDVPPLADDASEGSGESSPPRTLDTVIADTTAASGVTERVESSGEGPVSEEIFSVSLTPAPSESPSEDASESSGDDNSTQPQQTEIVTRSQELFSTTTEETSSSQPAAATELPPKDQQIVEGETANQSLQRIVSYNAVRAGTVNQVEGTAQISPQSQVSNDIVQQAAPEKKTTGEKSTETKVPEWRPFVMDCSNEDDDRGSELCMEWASGGLCTSNRPTMFLFCRKTCLCVGPRSN